MVIRSSEVSLARQTRRVDWTCLFGVSSGDCGSGWMMNRVRDGSKFFYNIHTQVYAWSRREDVVKDFSLLTKEEIQVSCPSPPLPSPLSPAALTQLHLPVRSLSGTGKDVWKMRMFMTGERV